MLKTKRQQRLLMRVLQMKNSNQLMASFLLMSVFTGALADTLDCNIAGDLTEKSYNRVKLAVKSKDKNAATMYSRSFWDIQELSEHCPSVRSLANVLEGIDYTKKDAVVADTSPASITPDLLNTRCPNPPCQGVVIHQGPGYFGGTGLEVPRELRDTQNIIIENPSGKSSTILQDRLKNLSNQHQLSQPSR